jgi:hypothetical protein
LNAGLAVAAACLWLGMAQRGEFWKADFSSFYIGWSVVLDGHGDRLYDFAEQERLQSEVLPERAGTGALLPYVYPPPFSVFAPLALLPLRMAFYTWAAAQAGLLLLALRWLCEDARIWGPGAPAIAATALLAFQPVFLTFQLGQQALISLIAFYGLARSLTRDRNAEVGAWLALAILKPQLALLPVIFLMGAGRWRALAVAGGISVVWAGVATLLLGPNCWVEFLKLTSFHARQFDTFGVFPLRGHNLKMVFAALLGPEGLPTINTLTAVSWSLAAATALVLGWIGRNAEPTRRQLALGLTLILGVLSAPHLNPHDDLALVVPAVLLYGVLDRTGRPTGALAALLVLCPLLFLLDSYALDWWPSRVRPFLFVTIALAVWTGRELFHHIRFLRDAASASPSAKPQPI